MDGPVLSRNQTDAQRRVRRRMAAAFLMLGLLALVGAALVAYQMLVGIRGPLALSRRAETKMLHTAELARHGTAVAAALYQYGLAPRFPEEALAIRQRVDQISWHMEQIEPLITPDEQQAYDRAVTLFASFREVAREALEVGQRGEEGEVGALLQTRLIPVLSEARPIAERLIDKNRAEAAMYLHRSNDRMGFVLWATLICTGLFVLCIGLAGWYSIRIVRRQQERISDQMGRLEHAVRDLDAFAGRVAHDIRGPLAPILLASEQLLRTSDPVMVQRSAERILRSARSANDLIESLLGFSRAGEACPGGRSSAARAAEQAVDETRDAARDAKIELQMDVGPHEVAIEEALLAQCIQNLMSNAIRYMPPDASRRRVSVHAYRRGSHVRFAVADTGGGIPRGERDQVFCPFYRGADVSPHVRGSGLGLATVQRIVEAHGGDLGIDDNPGGGAIVWFSIPLATRAAASPSNEASREQAADVTQPAH